MEINIYIEQRKMLYNHLLAFIQASNDDTEDYQNLLSFLKTENYLTKHEEFEHFLFLISNISNNHHRHHDFYAKIYKIIQHFTEHIKQTMSNQDIFNIFKSNKMILLYLVKNEIIKFDNYIIKYFIFSFEAQKSRLFQFFSPEMKEIKDMKEIKEMKEIIEINEEDLIDINLSNFDENRKIGENESYICKLIREDSVEEFISYVTRNNISLSNTIIKPSIFETNSFLIDKDVTLIEYAAFFGSIEIFQYLKMNQIDLNESLWLFAIHSKNATLIHLLEENQVSPQDETFEECLLESIKCHHNDISNYIENNLLLQNVDNNKLKEKIISCSFQYSNYEYFPYELDQYFAFYYLIRYNYSTLVNLFIKIKEKSIETIKIKTNICFFIKFFFINNFK